MQIYHYKHSCIKKENSLIDALTLDIRKKHAIAFVGGGGKSSIIHQIAKELSCLGKKCIVTTTTHIYQPPLHVVLKEDLAEVRFELEKNNTITVGTPYRNGKLRSVSDDFLQQLPPLCDVLLIEADGSKHFPIKAPAMHEPVIPDFTTLAIGVAGLDCLNKPIKEVSHRPELLATLLNKQTIDILCPEDVSFVLESTNGQKKGVHCGYQMIINKADTKELFSKALLIASCLSTKECLITSLRDSSSSVFTR